MNIKGNLRSFVYNLDLLRETWLRILNYRDKHFFKYRKLFNKYYFLYLVKLKRYEEIEFEEKIINGTFKVFLKRGTNTVVKINRKDNINSYNFYRSLRDKSTYRQYSHTLTSVINEEFLSEHVSEILKVFKDGGYESPYIEGENLQILKVQLAEGKTQVGDSELCSLSEAVEKLNNNLVAYNEKYRGLSGDWMLHNLVYDRSSKNIVNIDLEGFYTFTGEREENNVKNINDKLEGFLKVLKNE